MPGVPYGSAVGDGSTKWKVVRSSPINGTQSVFFFAPHIPVSFTEKQPFFTYVTRLNIYSLDFHESLMTQGRVSEVLVEKSYSVFFFLPIFPCYSLITLSFS